MHEGFLVSRLLRFENCESKLFLSLSDMSKKRKIIIGIVCLLLVFVGWFVYQLVGPSPGIVVSKQTTWLTEPLADDGLPDYATWLLDQQREGVTPDNNAAIPFLQAMWPAELLPEHQGVICDEIGMEVPERDGFDEPGYDTARDNSVHRKTVLMLLAKHDIVPPGPIENNEQFQVWRNEWMAENGSGDNFAEPFDEFGGFADGWTAAERAAQWKQAPFEAADSEAELMIDNASGYPWTTEQLPPLAEWINENEANYDLLLEAASRPKYYCPSYSLLKEPNTSFVAILLSDLQAFRSAIRVLSVRSMYHLGQEDIAAAWRDCEAMYRLADLLPGDWLVGELVKIACHGVADSVAGQIMADPKLEVQTATAMHQFFANRPLRRAMTTSIDQDERLMMITSLLNIAGVRMPEGDSDNSALMPDDMLSALSRANIDWNIVLTQLNDYYDRMAGAMAIDDFKQRRAALEDLDAAWSGVGPNPSKLAVSILSRNARSELMADTLASLLLPAVSGAQNAEDRSNSNLQLMQTAAALALYRVENGDYPDTLDELVDKYLPAVPVDLFHGNKLSYEKTADGYLLYCLGANGIDDGGSHHFGWYKGYDDVGGDEAQIRKALGMPPLGDGDETLDQLISDDADDWAIRMPPLEAMNDER